MSTLAGDVVRFQNGRIWTFPLKLRSPAHQIEAEPDGSILLAAPTEGLIGLRGGNFQRLTKKNGLPCDGVLGFVQDDEKTWWLEAPCGYIIVTDSEMQKWWAHPDAVVHQQLFDAFDGARTRIVTFNPATKSPDGRLWFASFVLQTIDPRHILFNKLPPPVHIEQITADRKTYDPASYGNERVPLPARTRDLEVDYTALSLSVSEKVRFRYKLEGRDRDWQDAGTRRQAFYSDLPPRNYRFRVIACNNSGVWDEAGALLDFSVAPAYFQTNWFRALLFAVFLGLSWALYHIRLWRLAREYDIRLEERVGERTRIARELHDSLLQGFHGLMFRLQAVRDLLPGRPSEAVKALEIALERGDKAIEEGRDTVSDLREPIVEDNDVAAALTALGEELAAQSDNGSVPCVRVLVEGKQRELNPMLRDEIYRIGREALRNAFRHARAEKIEAQITYGDSELLLHVRDDGIGIAREVADQGARAGHWGLPGMRERAKSFGGKLEVWSEHGSGTEIELVVPAAIAYGGPEVRRRFWFLRKKVGVADGKQS